MAVVKFSKQTIQPNPIEVDYWVDIKTDPYGSVWKYYNGTDWVALNLGDGSGGGLPAFDYYTKTQINEMLNKKADIELVESKVDDAEFAEVIQNIEFREIGDDSMELVMLKYDGIVVGITIPIATETNAGMIAGKDFKNFVKQHQLQQLYTEMYDIVKEIREQYQPRLKAGKNIMIDRTTNTIHATGKISTDWNALTNVPDLALQPDLEKEVERATNAESILDTRITSHVTVVETSLDLKADKANTYTKDQIDSKLSGVYRIKGSCLFEQLPTDPTVGDTWNILNDFTLNSEEHPFGTNVVYTDNGWDALAGIFDSSELEGDISGVSEALAQETIRAVKAEQANADAIVIVDGKLVNYLPLSGGMINGRLGFSGGNSPYIYGDNTYLTLSYAPDAQENTVIEKQTLRWNINNKASLGAPDHRWSNIYSVSGNFSGVLTVKSTTGSDYDISTNKLLTVPNSQISGIASSWTDGFTDSKEFKRPWYGLSFGTESDASKLILASFFGMTFKTGGSDSPFIFDGGQIQSQVATGTAPISVSSTTMCTNLNADLLDGKHLATASSFDGVMHSYKNGTFTTVNQYFGNGVLVTIDPKPTDDDTLFTNTVIFSVGECKSRNRQLAFGYDDYTIKYRYINDSPNHDNVPVYRDWKTIAFTDSNITGNAATATKLATPVKLWGQSFDGTEDIDGQLTITSNVKNGINIVHNNGDTNSNALLSLNLDLKSGSQEKVYVGKYLTNYNSGYFSYRHIEDDSQSNFMSIGLYGQDNILNILANGNVGIGTTGPQYKLDVNGSIHSRAGMLLNDNGNLTIGDSDLAGSNYKLYVDGTQYTKELLFAPDNSTYIDHEGTPRLNHGIDWKPGNSVTHSRLTMSNYYGITFRTGVTDPNSTGFAFAAGDKAAGNIKEIVKISCGGKITANEIESNIIDWYGVSWSENSSDPTCTRIGNMALHRSLPIQSAMKGYFIANQNAYCPDMLIPFDDSWSQLCYNQDTNNVFPNTSFNSGNTMVKIPEFWYIDDYEPSTKTHNLKISQTAKAGWCHHKEAYVGAYEGYNDGTYYRSITGVTPTVSVSRTTLRPLARENGYEDEYKWNIYTYEEHRAICHLFLVEYATRNSQAAVNTALTSDGFKQGGLGSGCTTGTVTINGVTTYSFIPTGTTDSLGNGSGQVAYTVTQTDADGNETGTVTRYANRYRGIENPFGHIWKHVDDIVNVYNAETTYKTVYKCNKPEHFATNKNAKYKPLCSFPGGAKMQGWSKEIKATINCDFFKYSIGGSETTYWCDYNYDNDDTSEHCLLIGGSSDYGGGAGLFRFYLADGVGASAVNIGSRLTYLPWAE